MRNLLVSGGLAHDFEVTSGRLAAALADVGIASTIDTDPEAAFASLPRDDVDLLTVNALRWRMEGVERYAPMREEWGLTLSPQARAGVEAHLAAGRPLLAVHTATICFDDWPRWGEIVGAAWAWDRSSHPPIDGEVAVTVATDRHPIVAGVGDFAVIDEVYGFLDRQPDVAGLLHASHGGTAHPLLWARTLPGGARVVYDALGHDARSYDHPTHQTLLRRIGAWLRGDDDTAVAGIA